MPEIGNEEPVTPDGELRQQVNAVLEVFGSERPRRSIENGTGEAGVENDGSVAALSQPTQRVPPKAAWAIDEGCFVQSIVGPEQPGSGQESSESCGVVGGPSEEVDRAFAILAVDDLNERRLAEWVSSKDPSS
jgi:hypothetical protein